MIIPKEYGGLGFSALCAYIALKCCSIPAPAGHSGLPIFENSPIPTLMHDNETLFTVRDICSHYYSVIDVIMAGAKNRVGRI